MGRTEKLHKESDIAATDRVVTTKYRDKRRGPGDRAIYRVKVKRTGRHIDLTTDELFDLTEILDDMCDYIEDQELLQRARDASQKPSMPLLHPGDHNWD